MNEAIKYIIALSLIPRVGSITARNLIAYCGSFEAVFKEKRAALEKIPGIGKFIANAVYSSDTLGLAQKEIEFIAKKNIGVITYQSEHYPFRLKQTPDHPLLLFYKGNGSWDADKMLSIVGTRKATGYGTDYTRKLVEDMKQMSTEVSIVSGLAYGIDICAHRSALDNQLPTIAVLAHGLNRIYPADHAKYEKRICDNGLFLTEFGKYSLMDKNNFLRRNRIIAGLTDATLIAESAIKGGALVTADIANSYDREVFAFPGRVNDTYSRGCNKLIKNNEARLIENAEDLVAEMGWSKSCQPLQQKLLFDLNPQQEEVINLLKNQGQISLDELAKSLGRSVSIIHAQLLELEFMGAVKTMPGKQYKAV